MSDPKWDSYLTLPEILLYKSILLGIKTYLALKGNPSSKDKTFSCRFNSDSLLLQVAGTLSSMSMKEALVGSLIPTDWLEAQIDQVTEHCYQKCFFHLSASLPTELTSSPGRKMTSSRTCSLHSLKGRGQLSPQPKSQHHFSLIPETCGHPCTTHYD